MPNPYSRHACGRKQKAGRTVTVSPPTVGSSSEDKVRSLSVDQVKLAISNMLSVYTQDQTKKADILQSVLASVAPCALPTVPPVAAAAAASVVPTPEITISAAPSELVPYNPNAFSVKVIGGELVPRKAGSSTQRQAKHQYVKKFNAAYNSIPTEEQKLLVVHGWLSSNSEQAPVQEALRSVAFGAEGIDFVHNLKEIWALSNEGNRKRLADSVGFRRTFLTALAPTTNDVPSKRAIRKLGAILGVKSRTFHSQFKRAVQTRNSLMLTHNNKEPLLQVYTKKRTSRISHAVRARLEDWMMNECDEINASPNAKDSVLCVNPETGLKDRKQKYYYLSSIREVHNAMLKTFPEAKSASGKVLISDTMLRGILPRWLSRMTDSHKEMCGCEPCMIVKQFIRTIVAWIRRFITCSENDEDTEDVEALRAMFLGYTTSGTLKSKFEHPREIVSLMTCAPPNGKEDLFRMRCCLGRCENCPKLNLPTILKNSEEGAPLICYQDYKYHSYCTIHKSLQGAPTKCPHCEELDSEENNGKKGKLLRKKHLTRNRKPIGMFMEEVFIPKFETYRYHLIHVILLGKNYCVDHRKNAYPQIDGSILVQRDFADRIIAAFTDQIQSTHFGENASMSMEGNTVRWGESNFHYHSFLADNSDQDSRTVFVNTVALIRFLQEHHQLLHAGSWFFELMDGCAKQYRSGTALYLLTVLAVMFKLIFDRMIQAPHHGKGDCDSQGGIDKNYLRRYFRKTIVPEENSTKKGIEAHTVGEDGVRASIAERLASILRDPSRDTGSKGDRKHEKREASSKIQQRHYHVIHNGKTDHASNVELPIQNTKFKVKGFPSAKKGAEKYCGLMAHYHFHADPNLGIGKIAARRVPCLCPPCFQQLRSPWQENVAPQAQLKFQTPANCHLRECLEDTNDWIIVTLVEGESADEEEIQTLYETVLDEHEAAMGDLIDSGDFAAVETSASDGYYVIRWTDTPCSVEEYDGEDLAQVEGCDRNKLQEGTMVCKGIYYTQPGRARQWYVPPSEPDEYLFRVRYVVATGLTMEEPSATLKFPVAQVKRRDRDATIAMGPLRLSDSSLESIKTTIAMRDTLNYYESEVEVVELGGGDDDDTAAESEESSEDEDDLD